MLFPGEVWSIENYLTQSLLSRITFIMIKEFYGYVQGLLFLDGLKI